MTGGKNQPANVGALVSTANECEIMYNSGVQLLLMGRPVPAMQCLRKSSKLMFIMSPMELMLDARSSVSCGCFGEELRGLL